MCPQPGRPAKTGRHQAEPGRVRPRQSERRTAHARTFRIHGPPSPAGRSPERLPQAPYPEQAQQLPGTDLALDPAPDHGELTYRGSGRLEGLATIVTGADSGIGKAVALAFAREGADVVVAYLSEHPDAAGTVRLVEEAGRRAVPFAGDLRDEATCLRLIDLARRELGGVDVLVNNAAFQRRRDRIEDIPTEEGGVGRHGELAQLLVLGGARSCAARP